jgi:hypothetical protein
MSRAKRHCVPSQRIDVRQPPSAEHGTTGGCPIALGILLLCGAVSGLLFPIALVVVQGAAPSSYLGVVTGACGDRVARE